MHRSKFFSGEDVFGQEMLGGIGKGLHVLGYDLLIVYADSDDTEWAQSYLESGRVDGFVIMISNRRQWHMKILLEMGAPFIAWGVPVPTFNYCSVTGDNITGGMLATRHLIDTDRHRIVFLGGPDDELTVQ